MPIRLTLLGELEITGCVVAENVLAEVQQRPKIVTLLPRTIHLAAQKSHDVSIVVATRRE